MGKRESGGKLLSGMFPQSMWLCTGGFTRWLPGQTQLPGVGQPWSSEPTADACTPPPHLRSPSAGTMSPILRLGLLLSCLGAAAVVPLASAACKSDFCSLGKLAGPPFYGDIATGVAFCTALAWCWLVMPFKRPSQLPLVQDCITHCWPAAAGAQLRRALEATSYKREVSRVRGHVGPGAGTPKQCICTWAVSSAGQGS